MKNWPSTGHLYLGLGLNRSKPLNVVVISPSWFNLVFASSPTTQTMGNVKKDCFACLHCLDPSCSLRYQI